MFLEGIHTKYICPYLLPIGLFSETPTAPIPRMETCTVFIPFPGVLSLLSALSSQPAALTRPRGPPSIGSQGLHGKMGKGGGELPPACFFWPSRTVVFKPPRGLRSVAMLTERACVATGGSRIFTCKTRDYERLLSCEGTVPRKPRDAASPAESQTRPEEPTP